MKKTKTQKANSERSGIFKSRIPAIAMYFIILAIAGCAICGLWLAFDLGWLG